MNFNDIIQQMVRGEYGAEWDARAKRQSDLESAALERDLATRRAAAAERQLGFSEEAAGRARRLEPLQIAALERAAAREEGAPSMATEYADKIKRLNAEMDLRRDELTARDSQMKEVNRRHDLDYGLAQRRVKELEANSEAQRKHMEEQAKRQATADEVKWYDENVALLDLEKEEKGMDPDLYRQRRAYLLEQLQERVKASPYLLEREKSVSNLEKAAGGSRGWWNLSALFGE